MRLRHRRVDVGRVDEVQASVEGAVNDPDRGLVVGIPPFPEHHRPQAQRTDLHTRAAKAPILHHSSLDDPATLPVKRGGRVPGCSPGGWPQEPPLFDNQKVASICPVRTVEPYPAARPYSTERPTRSNADAPHPLDDRPISDPEAGHGC